MVDVVVTALVSLILGGPGEFLDLLAALGTGGAGHAGWLAVSGLALAALFPNREVRRSDAPAGTSPVTPPIRGDRPVHERRLSGAHPRLLELIAKENLLTPEQLQRAVVAMRTTHEGLGTVLARLGVLAEEEFLEFLSRKFAMPVINLQRAEVSEDVTRLVKKEIIRKYRVFPLRKVGSTLTLALSDPTMVAGVDDVQFATGLHVIPVLAAESTIREAIDKHYAAGAAEIDEILKSETTTLELVDHSAQKIDLAELGERAGEAPVIRFVNLIVADALRKRASDIHLEPYAGMFRVRYRIDGVLHDVMAPPKSMEAPILSRVKIMANLDIAERRLPQDGRISVRVTNKEVDIRVSTIPTPHGEKIALRILDKSSVVLDLAQLGFDEDDLATFQRAIQAPHGMILVTGPTGSGKSTTLYAAVTRLNSPSIHILTVEDPIEYNVAGINQVQAREDIGLSFATVLRSFLRQDPDVILVGEMRDTETAQIAVRAALTGHLVLSTLHTNDAPSTVTRLIDMGIVPFLVSSCLVMVVAQRLCRRICIECREPFPAPLSVLLDAGFPPEEAEAVTLYAGRGCASCAGTGYWGRIAIHEILLVNPEIQEAVVKLRSASEIRDIAVKQGMRGLRQSGLRKVVLGITTIEEVIRVTSTV